MVNLKYELFETPGIVNTKKTLELAAENAKQLEIDKIIIASTMGDTIKEELNFFNPKRTQIVCVTHNYGFREGIHQTFPEELKKELHEKGVEVVSGTLALSGVGSALLRKFQYFDMTTMFAKLIRTIICDGLKVGIEIALMAVDAGKISMGEDILTISGTGRGADTCCYLQAASSRLFEKLRVKAILAKPK
ncbi:hypothetical protein NEF87_000993 [Candidatus Lokiarchaeum ossiferum]|uniref:Pyruvate kinase C-terminal domain-containing protein n=1 Tax=Candidatus Lokiarchaeum ossiferum TaxID=2951803 RepID=A0ABY6HMG9_9ARCH|nr:hypothetical protein NEF87_000993 [Candidatus Lokiarchaeum sp. B-35]